MLAPHRFAADLGPFAVPRAVALATLFTLFACAEEQQEPGSWSCDPPSDLDAGTVRATVDGAAWSGTTAGYQVLPVGLQFQGYADDVGLTFRLVESALQTPAEVEGQDPEFDLDDPIEDVLEDQETPVEFALGNGNRDGADVTVAVNGEAARSTGEGEGGYLRITQMSEEDTGLRLTGCFFFEADTADGDDPLSATEGGFVIDPL